MQTSVNVEYALITWKYFCILFLLIRLSKVSLYLTSGELLVVFSHFSAISFHISLIGGIFISFFFCVMFKYHSWNDVITRQNILIKSLFYSPLADDGPGVMIHGHVWLPSTGLRVTRGGSVGNSTHPAPKTGWLLLVQHPGRALSCLPLPSGEPGQGARAAEELYKE